MASATQAVSQNPVDYAAFVAYVRDDVPACQRLRAICARTTDVFFQAVGDLPERPSWLVGVPTLVRLTDMRVSTGTQALADIEAYLRSQPAAVSGGWGAGAAISAQAASLYEDAFAGTSVDAAASSTSLSLFPSGSAPLFGPSELLLSSGEEAEDRGRYTDNPRAGAISCLTLDEMIRRREEAAGGGSAPAAPSVTRPQGRG